MTRLREEAGAARSLLPKSVRLPKAHAILNKAEVLSDGVANLSELLSEAGVLAVISSLSGVRREVAGLTEKLCALERSRASR